MQDFGLEITPRPDLPALVARWQREISVPELKAGFFAILDAADAMDCGRWLLDLRRREELTTPEVTAWVNADFFPKLPRRYAEPVRIAFLVSPMRAQQEHSGSSVATISGTQRPDQGFATGLFTDEAAAYRWLAG
ncbi:hypothetical protein ACFQT0_00885 [Hymenobacter humi]|uniref:STAS/SEC14 domain-containing protein n=1 Tax=Hymenobacter humi TaxID=1411620 RepID=A0ABW2TY39_9BACT